MSDDLKYRGCESHKDDKIKAVDFPPTYLVMQLAKNIKFETAQWLVNKIHKERKHGGAELLIRRQPHDSNENYSETSLIRHPLIRHPHSWIVQNASELGYEILSDKEIMAYVQNKDSFVEEDSNEECVSSSENIVTYREIEGMLTKCIEWYETQKEADLSKLIVIRQIRQLAVEKEKNSLVQKKITQFFKK